MIKLLKNKKGGAEQAAAAFESTVEASLNAWLAEIELPTARELQANPPGKTSSGSDMTTKYNQQLATGTGKSLLEQRDYVQNSNIRLRELQMEQIGDEKLISKSIGTFM